MTRQVQRSGLRTGTYSRSRPRGATCATPRSLWSTPTPGRSRHFRSQMPAWSAWSADGAEYAIWQGFPPGQPSALSWIDASGQSRLLATVLPPNLVAAWSVDETNLVIVGAETGSQGGGVFTIGAVDLEAVDLTGGPPRVLTQLPSGSAVQLLAVRPTGLNVSHRCRRRSRDGARAVALRGGGIPNRTERILRVFVRRRRPGYCCSGWSTEGNPLVVLRIAPKLPSTSSASSLVTSRSGMVCSASGSTASCPAGLSWAVLIASFRRIPATIWPVLLVASNPLTNGDTSITQLADGAVKSYRHPTRRKDAMSTPNDRSPGQDAAEPGVEETIADLEVSGEEAAEQVKGGGQRVRGTVKWIDDPAQPAQQ